MPVSKSEAVSRLSVAIDRCRGDSIPLSTETAEALGLKKSKSISKAEARKLIESEGESDDDAEPDPEPKPEVAKIRRGKAAKAAPESQATPSGEDPLS